MLTHLAIKNIVLIDACELAFARGLCVLTGETGAGKSILLDSLGLVLGGRADSGLVRHGEAQGSVTAEFDIAGNPAAQAMLAELELEPSDTLIIRRSVSSDGKSRALANDQPVSVAALRKLGEALVEIHGQHDQKGLMDAATHRAQLDAFGNHDALLADVREAAKAWKEAKTALEALYAKAEQSKREEDYLRHLAAELGKLAPQPGEETQLADQRTLMMQSEKLFATLSDAMNELNAGKGASAQIRSAQRVLMRSSLNSNDCFAGVIDTLDRAANEADEAYEQLEALGRESTYDAHALESAEERLFALRAAARKYNVSVDELAGVYGDAEARLKLIDSRGGDIAALEKEVSAARDAYARAAGALSKARAKAAEKLVRAIEDELAPLKMASARIRVKLEPLAEAQWGASGVESVTFEAATNAGKQSDVPFAPLHKIASGGELSRFMLAMKVAMSHQRSGKGGSTPTMIFDEIDAGTGGAVADAIGARLSRLGESAQVLVVTHLPQVAARGSQHLSVQKAEVKGRVTSSVTPLGKAERKEELARMMSGASVTPEARKAAQKLLEQAV